MPEPVIVAIITITGMIISSVITNLLTRRKLGAEINKMEAETEKIRIETEKLRSQDDSQTILGASQPVQVNIFPSSPDPENFNRIEQRILQESADQKVSQDDVPLFPLEPIKNRIDYLLQARREIELRIRNLLLDTGGGWAGSSVASTDKYLKYLRITGIISDEESQRINDFYFFTTPILFNSDIDDDTFLTVRYLLRELITELDRLRMQHIPRDSEA